MCAFCSFFHRMYVDHVSPTSTPQKSYSPVYPQKFMFYSFLREREKERDRHREREADWRIPLLWPFCCFFYFVSIKPRSYYLALVFLELTVLTRLATKSQLPARWYQSCVPSSENEKVPLEIPKQPKLMLREKVPLWEMTVVLPCRG